MSLPGPVPSGLDAQRRLGPDWADWLDRLPARAAEVADEWGVTFEGPLWYGFCSLVAPVRTADGDDVVLKLTFDGDDESEHEHLALQRWRGRGAVRLVRADPGRRALLLERLERRDLTEHWDVEACEVVAGLYRLLHIAAPPQLRTVTSYVERWVAPLSSLPRDVPIPRRLVEQTIALARDLCSDPPSTGRMIHGDLHYENVLAGTRTPWLSIDPKPMSGDPHYEPAPMLWNRWEELVGGPGGVRDGVRRRFHALVDTAGLDEHRARDWVVVRMVLNAHWAVEDAARARRALTGEERDWITRCITVAKAVQD
jgi:streptomycin 6-kinase